MKEHTVTYTTQECSHKNLKKIGMNLYYCADCGKIFNLIFTMQFSLDQALDYFGNNTIALKENKKKIMAAFKKREKLEAKWEREAIEEYKKKLENQKKNDTKKVSN